MGRRVKVGYVWKGRKGVFKRQFMGKVGGKD